MVKLRGKGQYIVNIGNKGGSKLKILVTGGAGFLGSYLLNELVDEGYEVFVYDVFFDIESLKFLLGERFSKIKMIPGDIQDLPLIMRKIKENGVKKVVHLATLLTTASHDNPYLAVKVNCLGMANILEAGRILGVEKIVWASSLAVGTHEEKPYEVSYRPWGLYGACKAFNASLANLYSTDYGLDITGLRFPLMYGEGQKGGVAATLVRELVIKPVLGESGDVPYGDDTIIWLYVRDAARAITLALKAKKPKTLSFNVGGDLRSIKEAREIVLKYLPNARILPQAGVMGLSWSFSTRAIEEEVGFKPFFPLEEGMRETIEHVRRRCGKGD